MRSDKIRDISMSFDSIAVDPMEIADRLARLQGLPPTQIEIRKTVLQVGPLQLDLIERTAERAGRTIDLLQGILVAQIHDAAQRSFADTAHTP